MNKFPLHRKGIQDLQHKLYALPDSKLAVEVLALRTDFKQWIKSKFELKQDELDFINELSPHFAEYAAIKSSNFLAQRKPIQFSIIEFRPETELPI
ncbi:MAG: hypothetical protein EOO07_00240 [Chitinophagaceae bacterium]|nr:MAG: hypothetical protein EOO07_00240 [Chitinophagaceae bacterium]